VDNPRNMILAIVLSALVLFGWSAISDIYFPQPKPVATAPAASSGAAQSPAGTTSAQMPNVSGAAPAPVVVQPRTVEAALTGGNRIRIQTPKLEGSINLTGARIDDLVLPTYRQKIDKDAPPVRLLAPAGTKQSYYAGFGWSGDGVNVPNAQTLWTADSQTLTTGKPVTLSWDNGAGQIFRIRIAIDNRYMFSVEQSVQNGGTGPVAVRAFGYVNRVPLAHSSGSMFAPTHDVDSWTMHIGPIGVFNDVVDYETDYETVDEAGPNGKRVTTTGGWLGFGETYWLTALVPPAGQAVDAAFRTGGGTYQAEFAKPPVIVQPGKVVTTSLKLFSGAKEVDTLNGYQDQGVTMFSKAITWGWFEIIERPIFWVLNYLFKLVGNFGVAIILLTFIVRGLMFPIANKQFASMAAMRAVQPKIKALQERYKDDKAKQQQEMMKLYQTEKINPLAGCAPILLQIPIFYALYKVLLLSIEMRHQPFALWIKDLSASDPAMILNLFGLLPFSPPAFLGIGVLAVLLGITMWLQFKLNPAQMDPVQQQMFAIMPWIMMFMMAPFAAGLLIYWITSNILTIAQQKWLYSKHPALKEPILAVKS
jgi:YidC/Oxa1 family membrane protein insertase